MNMHMVVKSKKGHVWYVCDSGSFYYTNREPFDKVAAKANELSEDLIFEVKEYVIRKDPPKHIRDAMRVILEKANDAIHAAM